MTDKVGELALFLSFAHAAGLVIESDSIRQDPPPSPDVLCRINGELRAFELTAATNQDIHSRLAREGVATSWIGAGRDELGNVTSHGEAVAAFRRKMDKTYRADCPIDLVIHESLAELRSSLWIKELFDELRKNLDHSPFNRVWVLSSDGSDIYATWPHLS